MERNELKKYLVSLVGPLNGYYLRVDACDQNCVRRWANKTLGNLWCAVYKVDEPELEKKIIGEVEVIWNYGEGK